MVLCAVVQKVWVLEPDVCEGNVKPSVLNMVLSGGGAGDSNNSQDPGKVTVTGSDVTSGPVWVISSDKNDPFHSKAKTWFEGELNIGDAFDASAIGLGKGDKLKGNTYFFIYTSDPDISGTLIQSIVFHTSCSQPLIPGEVIGAVTLDGFVAAP